MAPGMDAIWTHAASMLLLLLLLLLVLWSSHLVVGLHAWPQARTWYGHTLPLLLLLLLLIF